MAMLNQLLAILGAVLVLFILFRTIKGRPDLFTKENLNKSFFTMGVLGVGLIVFVTLLVLLLKQ